MQTVPEKMVNLSATAPKKPKPMLIRIGVGILGSIFFLTLVFAQASGLPFALAVAIFSILGVSELYRAVQRQNGEPTEFLGYIACVVFQFAAWKNAGKVFQSYVPAIFILLLIAALLAELVKKRSRPLVNVGATLLGAVWVGWMLSYLTLIRSTSLPGITPPIKGTTTPEWLVVFVTGATWLSDTGALFTGKYFGRHKLAPRISPAKTWEGSIGGLIVSALFGVGLGHWIHLDAGHAITLSVLCGVFGQVGDLCESAVKRDLGVKDFGVIFPGHGGVLDRVDSLLFAAPLAYYYLIFILK
jgi:phosphatidate cytidylyltransferase